jgi:hypothetical protein
MAVRRPIPARSDGNKLPTREADRRLHACCRHSYDRADWRRRNNDRVYGKSHPTGQGLRRLRKRSVWPRLSNDVHIFFNTILANAEVIMIRSLFDS